MAALAAVSVGCRRYLAIGEVVRFAKIRRQIGYQLSRRIMTAVADVINRSQNKCSLGRVGRKSIEFVFHAADAADAARILDTISQEIESAIFVDKCQLRLRTAFGAAPIDADAEIISDLCMHNAEIALCEALDARDRVMISIPDGEREASPAPKIAWHDFPRAIAGQELQLHYQPKLHCRSDTIHSVEALLRWHHPELGLINTQDLITIAEDTGAIHDFTRWVIEQAVADQHALDRTAIGVGININLSGSLLYNEELAEWALARMTCTKHKMGIEITETSVIDEPERAIANLHKFANAGIRIAIDDYGTGLSSLAYLKQLPANELKIDRDFVSDLTESHRDPLIIRSTIDLAHALDMEVTAEGVDDPLTFGLLSAMGCDNIQGYLIAKPMPFLNLLEFLQSWTGSEHHAPTRWAAQG